MFKRVLIANRGTIAVRIARTLRKLGIEPVAIYAGEDSGSPHVTMAAEAIRLPSNAAGRGYLDMDAVLAAAKSSGAGAIHPGYGFLSENAEFAEACESRSIAFIGPTSAQIRAFGLKHTAREIAARANAPIAPGTGLLSGVAEARVRAASIGYPVMLKSAGGGGGIGMRRCHTEDELSEAFVSVERLSQTHFKGSGLFLERFVSQARHVEVQIFGDGQGRVISLGERDCSVQRRNQKVVEETPAPGLSDKTRDRMAEVAVRIAKEVQYRSAGTVEFLYDGARDEFYFLEVNTRLQVEHGVTEEVTGTDLVEWMVKLAEGTLPDLDTLAVKPKGASIQVRVYAEAPLADFQPSSGTVTKFDPPAGIRIETWVDQGTEVTPYFDPLLAKFISYGATREEARKKLSNALGETRLYGVETNLEFLRSVIDSPNFVSGAVSTSFLDSHLFRPFCIRIQDGGVMTTIQDLPGRLGFWSVGVPPSGPMDDLSFRLGNRMLGNDDGAAGLECTLSGPTILFPAGGRIAITGADMGATLDGAPLATGAVHAIPAGSSVRFGTIIGPGTRTYILFAGGLTVPSYLGSCSTFTLGRFGGVAGRQVRAGDTIGLSAQANRAGSAPQAKSLPHLTRDWEIGVAYGPHGAPEYFTAEYIETFFATSWRVHHNSSRTGVRLVGPKPGWTRADGGEAGLHPSNIHDNAYAVGSIDFTGDMPILLGPDGPSLGGFVCPGVIVEPELWKMGQLAAGDSVRFVRADQEPAVLRKGTQYQVRRSGTRNLLVEFGDPVLDLGLRFEAHRLMSALTDAALPGLIDLTPGIRSLQIQYNPERLRRDSLLETIEEMVQRRPNAETKVASRVVHLPLSWDDPATRLAIERYMSSVRPDAPWCPSNIEFIRRMNGLESRERVHQIVFDASYLVLGLGDVYLGAPVATPLDPRHRLVTTKYNPARTWTPENAVGIGGAYLCVYGMEGPGGYQFVGRTLQMWNTHRTTAEFQPGKPYLLRFFDQIRFYPVSAEELLDIRNDFPLGRYPLRMEDQEFDLQAYQRFLAENASEIAAFRSQQGEAFAEERKRWAAQGEFESPELEEDVAGDSDRVIPEGCKTVCSPTTASVWSIEAERGQATQAGTRVLLLEAMKMEIAVVMPETGEVVDVLCSAGNTVSAGQPLVIYRPIKHDATS